MNHSFSLSKRLVLLHILTIQLFLLRNVTSLNLTNAYLNHKCIANQGKYKPGSEYEKNLNIVINFVSVDNLKDGYMITAHGKAPNKATIIFQCRGDSYGSKCRSCFATAVAELRRRCPGNKGATIWYDQCFLDVSTVEFSQMMIDYKNTFSMHNPKNVKGDIESFNKKMRDYLTELMSEAIIHDGDKVVFYAAGETKIGEKNVYAMVQCGKNTAKCKTCLESSISELSKCCLGKQGARVILGKSCNVRYEQYPFLRT